MKYSALSLIAILVFGIFLAGCTQSTGAGPAAPVVPVTTAPVPEPTNPVLTAPETTALPQVVTIVHQVSQVKDIKDSGLLFALQVPEEWSVSTRRLVNPEDSEGLVYQTDLVEGDVFFIQTYAICRSQDQAYRDTFRKTWSPAPVETTVTINGITYDRFESSADGKTRVAYVARKGSANERGYASVLVFTSDDRDRFQKDDFERIVASFKFFSAGSAGGVPGVEIPRTN
jgi:hypothetical protein